MSKIYLKEGGISVTDAMFISKEGEQYPIRNISSVRMGSTDRKGFLYAGVLIAIIGIWTFVQNATPVSQLFTFLGIAIIPLIIWFFGRTFDIYISTSGVEKKPYPTTN